MSNLPVLDVAIGLAFLFFVLSLVCSAVNEALAGIFHWRAKDLESGIRKLVVSDAAEKQLMRHPLLRGLVAPHAKRPYPSYIPSRTFVAALLDLEPSEDSTSGAPRGDPTNLRPIEESIASIESAAVRDAMTALYHSAQGDAVKFRRAAEQWYDDAMERVSGWYRRRIQKVLWVLAFVIVLALNADTLQLAKTLWTQPSVRNALVAQAQAQTSTGQAQPVSAKDTVAKLEALPVGMGWHWTNKASDPQSFPFWRPADLLAKLLGLSLTAVALSFGAPFWFDLLSKLARLRSSGAPPPASDAIRHGEGEETRAG
ncbi:MAG: hypothetical protein QOE36_2237 [Gaiellaceae bacterium]|nr:hypothetical protein [Gaiellaceae bacterium]